MANPGRGSLSRVSKATRCQSIRTTEHKKPWLIQHWRKACRGISSPMEKNEVGTFRKPLSTPPEGALTWIPAIRRTPMTKSEDKEYLVTSSCLFPLILLHWPGPILREQQSYEKKEDGNGKRMGKWKGNMARHPLPTSLSLGPDAGLRSDLKETEKLYCLWDWACSSFLLCLLISFIKIYIIIVIWTMCNYTIQWCYSQRWIFLLEV